MSTILLVERYLRLTQVAPSRFGRDVAGDPRLVFDLRRGREPRPDMAARMEAFINAHLGTAMFTDRKLPTRPPGLTSACRSEAA